MARGGRSADNAGDQGYTDSQMSILRQAASLLGISPQHLPAAARAFQSGLDSAPIKGNAFDGFDEQDLSHIRQDQGRSDSQLLGQNTTDPSSVRQSCHLLGSLNRLRVENTPRQEYHRQTVGVRKEPPLPLGNHVTLSDTSFSGDVLEFAGVPRATDGAESLSVQAADQIPPLNDSHTTYINDAEFADNGLNWLDNDDASFLVRGAVAEPTVRYTPPPISPPEPIPPAYTTEAVGLPPNTTRRTRGAGSGTPRKRKRNNDDAENRSGRRGPFQDMDQRLATACTRKLGACIRCQMQHIRVCISISRFFGTMSNPPTLISAFPTKKILTELVRRVQG